MAKTKINKTSRKKDEASRRYCRAMKKYYGHPRNSVKFIMRVKRLLNVIAAGCRTLALKILPIFTYLGKMINPVLCLDAESCPCNNQDKGSRSDVLDYELHVLCTKGYRIYEEIGNGSFSSVRKAIYKKRKEVRLAVKIVDKEKVDPSYMSQTCPGELTIWPKLHHKNIIKVHHIFVMSKSAYIFMELAPNGTVCEYLEKNGAVSEELSQCWFTGLARALKYCHKRKVAHRDVKLENLLLDEHLQLKLTDFSFTCPCVDLQNGQDKLCDTFCGSLEYMAPEILKGHIYDGLKADVWSAGVCLYALLNNSFPFDTRHFMKLIRDQEGKKWAMSPEDEDKLSSSCISLMTKMLESDPQRRITIEQVLRCRWMK